VYHRRRGSLPFCRIILKAPKPLPPAYPGEPKTLGDHIRKRRLDLNLLQKDVAGIIGVVQETVWNWEKGATNPAVRCLPGIIEFLGYVPAEYTTPKTSGEKIVISRKLLGISQKTLARMLDVDPGTLARWEKDEKYPSKKMLEKLQNSFLYEKKKKSAHGEEKE